MLRSLRNPHLFLAMLLPCLPACGDDGGGTGDGSTSTTDPSTSTATDPTNASADTSVTTTDVTDPTEASSSGTTDPTDATSTTASDSTGDTGASSQVRVLHLGVRAPAVDVFANGDGPVFEALEFRNSTQYAEVPPGDYTFEVSVSGTPASEAVLAPELTLDAGVAYTAVAIGDLEMTDGAPGLQAIALVDDAEGIDAANVRVTVVHAAPAVGQVDIWEISADPVPLLEDVDFGASATLPDIPAGPLEIGVDVDNDATPDVTFSVDASPLAGAQVNIFANNDEAGDVALVAQLQDGTVLAIPAN
ncbi:MAG: DUF4397 domain-containing protein [Nannocystaceae bacterium]|nr:DUF4397 domain-containing protein [Nannocystaceae bacterium]